MKTSSTELKDEKKNKKRGMFYSFTVHALLLLIAIWPFLNQPADIDKNFAIVVEFEKPIVVKKSGSESQASAKSSSSDAASAKSEEQPKPSRSVQKVEQIEKTKVNTPSTTPVKPVLTAPDVTAPKWSEPVKTPEKLKSKNPTKVPTTQSKSEPTIEDFLPELDKIIEEEQSGTGTGGVIGDSEIDPNGSGQGGQGGTGIGKKDNGGTASGSGTSDNNVPPGDFGGGYGGEGDGLGAGGFDGEGPLKRARKFDPKCGQANAVVNAKIVMDLCINRDGQITYSKYNIRKSTIKDKAYARSITSCFRKMTFKEDQQAMGKECGTYTYKISFQG